MVAAGASSDTVDWLLSGDPSIRWQVMAHILEADAATVAAERARVGGEGWGPRLLAVQDGDGSWAGAQYSPKWTSTTYTLLLLAWLGLAPGHPQALLGWERLWEWREGGGGSDRTGRPEACILGMLVMVGAAHGADPAQVDQLVDALLGRQLEDGGWNCAARPGHTDTHSSFHTTISALDGLQLYVSAGGTVDVAPAAERGRRFFLAHRLYRSHRSDAVAIPVSTRFPFPPQWHFDVLRGLEHFAASGADRDPRLEDAVDLVLRRRRPDGRWSTYRGYPGQVWFTMEEPGASRWNTLRALRMLRWWEGDAAVAPR